MAHLHKISAQQAAYSNVYFIQALKILVSVGAKKTLQKSKHESFSENSQKRVLERSRVLLEIVNRAVDPGDYKRFLSISRSSLLFGDNKASFLGFQHVRVGDDIIHPLGGRCLRPIPVFQLSILGFPTRYSHHSGLDGARIKIDRKIEIVGDRRNFGEDISKKDRRWALVGRESQIESFFANDYL